MNRWQYPELAEPFFPARGGDVKVDKWQQPAQIPRLPVATIAFLTTTLAFVEVPEEAAAEVSLDRWEPRLIVPLFDRPRNQHLYPTEAFLVLDESQRPGTIFLDKWEPKLIVPLFDVSRTQYLYPSWSFGNEATLPSPEIVLDRWEPRLIVPLFDKVRQQWSYPSFFYQEFQANIVIPPMDTWDPRVYKPLFDVPRQQWTYPTFFSLGEPIPGTPILITTHEITLEFAINKSRTLKFVNNRTETLEF